MAHAALSKQTTRKGNRAMKTRNAMIGLVGVVAILLITMATASADTNVNGTNEVLSGDYNEPFNYHIYNGGSLDLNTFKLTTAGLYLGYWGGTGDILRSGGGTIETNTLSVQKGSTFTTASGDSFGTGDFRSGDGASLVTLGADLNKTSGNIHIDNGGEIDLNSYDLSTGSALYLGYYGGIGTLTRENGETISVSTLFVGGGTDFSTAIGDGYGTGDV